MLDEEVAAGIGQYPQQGGEGRQHEYERHGQRHDEAGDDRARTFLGQVGFDAVFDLDDSHAEHDGHGEGRAYHADEDGEAGETGNADEQSDPELHHMQAHDDIGQTLFRQGAAARLPQVEELNGYPHHADEEREGVEVQEHHTGEQGGEHGPERRELRPVHVLEVVEVPGKEHLPPALAHDAQRGDHLIELAVAPRGDVQGQPQRYPDAAVPEGAFEAAEHTGGHLVVHHTAQGRCQKEEHAQDKAGMDEEDSQRFQIVRYFRAEAEREELAQGIEVAEFPLPRHHVIDMARGLEIVAVPQLGHLLHEDVEPGLDVAGKFVYGAEGKGIVLLEFYGPVLGLLYLPEQGGRGFVLLPGEGVFQKLKGLLFLFQLLDGGTQGGGKVFGPFTDALDAFGKHGEVGRHTAVHPGKGDQALEFLLQRG